jgi:hypothetical protein
MFGVIFETASGRKKEIFPGFEPPRLQGKEAQHFISFLFMVGDESDFD